MGTSKMPTTITTANLPPRLSRGLSSCASLGGVELEQSPEHHFSGEQRRPSAQFSYESLDESNYFLLASSITHQVQRNRRQVAKILFGWVANYFMFAFLISIYMLHSCQLFEPEKYRDANEVPAANTDELIIGWFFSAANRFIPSEPMVIMVSKFAPLLFASAFCANCLGETITNTMGLVLTALVQMIKSLKA